MQEDNIPKKVLKKLEIVSSKVKSKQELENELKNEGFSFYEWSDSPGAHYPPHFHKHDECICVVEGKISFYINKNEYELKAGQKLYLPALTMHEAKNKSDKKVTYLIGER